MDRQAELTEEQLRTLSVLAFLLWRMGQASRAEDIWRVVAKVGGNAPAIQRQARIGCAAARLAQEDPQAALDELRGLAQGTVLSSRDAALHLMRAQALWMQGRSSEAQQARDEYLFQAGHEGGSH